MTLLTLPYCKRVFGDSNGNEHGSTLSLPLSVQIQIITVPTDSFEDFFSVIKEVAGSPRLVVDFRRRLT